MKALHNSAEPLRVLHCIYGLTGGGAEKQLRLLAGAPPSSGLVSAIFCADDLSDSQLEVTIYKYRRQRRLDLSVFFALSRAIDSFRPEVIHVWLPASITIPAMLVAWWKRVPIVFSFRNVMRIRRWIHIPELLLALLVADGVLSNTDYSNSSSLYRWLYKIKKSRVINNAVGVQPSSPAKPEPIGEFRLLFAGRLTKQKNCGSLIRALSFLSGDDYRFILSIFGKGEQETELRELVRCLNLAPNVQFLGYRRDLIDSMQDYDLLVLPSLWEGTPNVVLEAFASGLPCVLSDIAPHRQLVGTTDCACLVSPSSPIDIARSIYDLASRPERRKTLADSAKCRAMEFSVDRMVSGHLDYYLRLVGRAQC